MYPLDRSAVDKNRCYIKGHALLLSLIMASSAGSCICQARAMWSCAVEAQAKEFRAVIKVHEACSLTLLCNFDKDGTNPVST